LALAQEKTLSTLILLAEGPARLALRYAGGRSLGRVFAMVEPSGGSPRPVSRAPEAAGLQRPSRECGLPNHLGSGICRAAHI
jgi:hypothetical protein